MCSGQEGQSQSISVLLNNSLHHLFRRLVQTGVDDLKTSVTKGSSNNLGAAVVSVQSRFGDDYSVGPLHESSA